MAGLFDGFSPELLGLLGGGAKDDKRAGGQTGLGLLKAAMSGDFGRSDGVGGLLGGWRGPSPDENLSTRIFGNPNDRTDPRGQAMMALSLGLMRGNFADGMEGANKAFTDTEDRNSKRALNGILMGKGALELQGLFDDGKRNRSIRGDLDALDAQQRKSGGQSGALGGWPTNIGTGMQGAESLQSNFAVGNADTAPYSGGVSQPQNQTQAMHERLMQEAQIYSRHGDRKTALEILSQAQKWRPEYSMEFRQVVDPQTNKLVNVQASKDGTIRPIPWGVKPDIQLENLGGRTLAIDKNMTQGGQSWGRSMTPGELASNGVAQGNLRVARERLALDRDAPQYMQTDGGLIALPKRPSAGPIIGRPVTGEDGQAYSAPLKPIPAAANTAILANAQNLKRATDALTLVQGGEVGSAKGDKAATGWKGYTPNTALNIIDPAGVDTRAAIADLGSMVIHDRSGAAVTASEYPRLAPFIPRATDDAATAAKKLQRFVEVYQQEAQALGETYSREQGYRPSSVVQRSAQGGGNQTRQPAVRGLPLPPNPTASSLKVGQTYTLPNGAVATWDGLQFKAQK